VGVGAWLGTGLVEEPAWTAPVSAGCGEPVGAGVDAGAGFVVCSSGVAATSWLGGAGLAFAGTGEISEGCVPVGWSGPGTVFWLAGVVLVGVPSCAVCVSLGGCDGPCAGVDAGAWFVGVGLTLSGVGDAVGA
jgi:hypothetical protein